MTDPFENVVGAVADVGERLVEYAEVWRSAIDRNACGDYAADDFMVDLQALWGMGARDAARIGAAFIDGLAPLLSDDAFGPGQKRPDPERAPTDQSGHHDESEGRREPVENADRSDSSESERNGTER